MAVKYRVVPIGQNAFIEIKSETLNDAPYMRLFPSIGSSAISLRLDKTETLELIDAIADVAELVHIADAVARHELGESS